MYNYNNPCLCGSVLNGGGGSSPCDGECIHVPNMLIIGNESIPPCGVNSVKSVLWDKCLNVCTCEKNGDNVTFEVLNTKNLIVTNIDDVGIEVRGDAENTTDTYGEVQFIVRCGRLSNIGTLTVVFNNLCKNKTCVEGQTCNKCTGNCVATAGVDLDVT